MKENPIIQQILQAQGPYPPKTIGIPPMDPPPRLSTSVRRLNFQFKIIVITKFNIQADLT